MGLDAEYRNLVARLDGREPLSIHKIFAVNLRQACTRFASIADVCRKTGINRQQFNRYLSGQNLPNPRTMKRLCKFLGVDESLLFVSGESTARPASDEPHTLGTMAEAWAANGLVNFDRLLEGTRRSGNSDLPSGYYYCYAAVPDEPEFCVRMLLQIRNEGGVSHFCRRTAFKRPGDTRPDFSVGRHIGILVGDPNGSLLLGWNRTFPFEYSAMRIGRSSGGPRAPRGGLALVRATDYDIACKLVTEWVGNTLAAAKKAYGQIGIVSLKDPSLPSALLAMLETQDASNPAFIATGVSSTVTDYVAKFRRETEAVKNGGVPAK